MDAYYSIIEKSDDGYFHGWVPDLARVRADGGTEEGVVDRLFRDARECLRNLILVGAPVPRPRLPDDLPGSAAGREVRRLLLVITQG